MTVQLAKGPPVSIELNPYRISAGDPPLILAIHSPGSAAFRDRHRANAKGRACPVILDKYSDGTVKVRRGRVR